VAKLPFSVSVDVVEPSEAARQLAQARLKEVACSPGSSFSWHNSVHDLKSSNSDLVIVATSAAGRVGIIGQLLESGHTRFLVEKMVCQSTREYDTLLRQIKSRDAKGWVNTPRRYFESYRKIKENISSSGPIHMSVVAGNLGLGSNAIHFLDLFSWFCKDYEVSLSGEFLYDRLLPNKRSQNLVEMAGTILGASKNHSIIEISFIPYDDDDGNGGNGSIPLTVDLISKDMHAVIDETAERVTVLRPEKDSSPLNGLLFHNEYVSDTTTRIAADILADDRCALPSIEQSYFAHSELFRIFNAHISKLAGRETELCPVT
ncbi:MAG: hypothetical protein C4292_03230, partial [Nitrososphaera sp.]